MEESAGRPSPLGANSKHVLPPWIECILRLIVGSFFAVGVKVLSWLAFLDAAVRRILLLPNAGVPCRAFFYTATASTGADSADAELGPPEGPKQLQRDDTSVVIDIKDARDTGQPVNNGQQQHRNHHQQQQQWQLLRQGSPGQGNLVEVMHVPVDLTRGTDSDAWRLVGPFFCRYGSGTLASTSLWNPEYHHMFVPGVGSQPYVIAAAYHHTAVLGVGDPIAHPRHWAEVARAFRGSFPSASYVHVSEKFARVLQEVHGYTVADMGAETTLMVQRFRYHKRTRTLRTAARDARLSGVTVREVRAEDLTPEVCGQLALVTADWLDQKAVKERVLRVFVRHMDYHDMRLQGGVRLFVAERTAGRGAAAPSGAAKGAPGGVAGGRQKQWEPPAAGAGGPDGPAGSGGSGGGGGCGGDGSGGSAGGGGACRQASQRAGELVADGDSGADAPCSSCSSSAQICGFVLLDPMYRDGRLIGYVTSLNRMLHDSHHGVLKLLYEETLAVTRSEGLEVLAFGISPFFNLQRTPFCGPWWVEVVPRYLYHLCNRLYQFKKLAFSKARYGGGVVGDAYADPDVIMTHVYYASWAKSVPNPWIMMDNYVFMMYVGFVGDAWDTFCKLVGLKQSTASCVEDAAGGPSLPSKAAPATRTPPLPLKGQEGGGGGHNGGCPRPCRGRGK